MSDEELEPSLTLADDRDFEEFRAQSDHERLALVELVNRVLDKGVVVTGEVTIAVGGVDLVFLGLQLVLSSVEGLIETKHVRPHKLTPPRRRP